MENIRIRYMPSFFLFLLAFTISIYSIVERHEAKSFLNASDELLETIIGPLIGLGYVNT